jgi:hypothetical protein
MPVPGYDPDDVDDLLETKLEATDVQQHLSNDEWQSYQNDDASLVELLDDEKIDQLLEEN